MKSVRGYCALCAAALLCIAAVLCAAEHGSIITVVIDPAHGGTDEGVRLARGISEKNATLNIAHLIQNDMEMTGRYRVVLTRAGDSGLSIEERRRLAKNMKADLFISIHVNAGFGPDASGYEVYYTGPGAMSGKEGSSGTIINDMVKTETVNESVRFAHIVRENLSAVFTRQDRGIRSAPAAVLRRIDMPAVVLELPFATNVSDRKKMQDEEVWNDVARSISAAIRKYFSERGK